jgi:hypothetical protein
MDMARSMLAEFKSPYNFWAEATTRNVLTSDVFIMTLEKSVIK